MNIINQNIEAINELCRKHKVKELYAFGSVTDENKFNEKSDVDLLVDFDKSQIELKEFADNFFDFAEELETVLGRRVDLITLNSLRNKYFIRSVNRSKTKVYAA